MAPERWRREDLEEQVAYLEAKGYAVGRAMGLEGVPGPDPREPPFAFQLRVEAIWPGQAIVNGMAYESGDFVWVALPAHDCRVALAKIVAVGRDAVVLAPLNRLRWEHAPHSPLDG